MRGSVHAVVAPGNSFVHVDDGFKSSHATSGRRPSEWTKGTPCLVSRSRALLEIVRSNQAASKAPCTACHAGGRGFESPRSRHISLVPY
jgi:hypothetical protein